jgi:hypothetical protein
MSEKMQKNKKTKTNFSTIFYITIFSYFLVLTPPLVSSTIQNSNDLCYENPIVEGFQFGPMNIFYGVTTPIRNISGEDITNAVVIKSFDGIDMSMMQTIKLDNVEKTVQEDNDTAEINQDLQVSFAGMFNAGGLFGKGIVYHVGDFDPDAIHTIYDYSMFSFDMSKISIDAIYTKNGQTYKGVLYPCDDPINNIHITGPFDAWDTFRDISDRNISTKISGKEFSLTIASINKNNDGTETKEGIDMLYQLYSDTKDTNLTQWEDYNASSGADGAQNNKVFHVYVADKSVNVKFKICADFNGTDITLYPTKDCSYDCVNNSQKTSGNPCFRYFKSSDDFAIRPYRFLITNIPTSTVKSADDFNITIQALDFNGNKTKDYNETLNITTSTSPFLEHNETKNGCITGDLNSSATVSFANGEANATLKYSEIGDINLTVGENNDTGTFAYVDENDTNITQLLIDKNTTTIRILPDHFEVNASFRNFANGFTYISKDLNMSAILDVNVTAKNEQNITTKNYNTACYAKKTDYNITYANLSITPVGSLSKVIYHETNSSRSGESAINSDINLTNTSESIFAAGDHNGTAVLKFLINFDREKNTTVNAFILNIKDINVSDANNTTGGINLDKNATFYYGRVHSPDYRFDGNNGTATIYYEVYSDQNKTTRNSIGITGKESVDSIDWYINTLHADINSGYYAGVSTPVAKDGTVISNMQINSIDLSATAPHKDKITLTPNPWLVYDKFNPDTNTTNFLVEFNKAGTTWAGKGIQGKTVDLNISTTQNKRLDW